MDVFLALSLLDLTEKVSQLNLTEDLPAAPLREELIDRILDSALENATPLSLSGNCSGNGGWSWFHPSTKRRLPIEVAICFYS